MLALLAVATGASWAFEAASLAATKDAPRTIPFAIDSLPIEYREPVRKLLEKPTLSSSGPIETFVCNPAHYYWLLDHPHRAVEAWRSFGAVCVPINALGNGNFGWDDDTGSAVSWTTIARTAEYRVWYAQGKVRSTKLMPFVPVQGIVVMHHNESRSPSGEPVIHHHADLYLVTESRALGMTTRLFGASANRLAEQGLEQLEFFFSGMSRLLTRYPERAEVILQTSRK